MRGGLAQILAVLAASSGMPDEYEIKTPDKPKRKSRAVGHRYYVPIPYLGLTVKRASHAHQQRLARKNKQIKARSPK